ncbi:hypothetical protein T492DRAFT_857358 [Pavlovales sp. CCMP2436]|nr:hypothetical protein T492DRAFT_857358 [Pavlovales sp. CCMP2436]
MAAAAATATAAATAAAAMAPIDILAYVSCVAVVPVIPLIESPMASGLSASGSDSSGSDAVQEKLPPHRPNAVEVAFHTAYDNLRKKFPLLKPDVIYNMDETGFEPGLPPNKDGSNASGEFLPSTIKDARMRNKFGQSSPIDFTWEPESNLPGYASLVREFIKGWVEGGKALLELDRKRDRDARPAMRSATSASVRIGRMTQTRLASPLSRSDHYRPSERRTRCAYAHARVVARYTPLKATKATTTMLLPAATAVRALAVARCCPVEYALS